MSSSTPHLAVVVLLCALAGCGGSAPEPRPSPTAAATVFTVPEELPPPATTTTEAPAETVPDEPEPEPAVAAPPIVDDLIPFPEQRKAEMAAYAERHYGISSYLLRRPQVIVEHVAVAPSAASVKATFSPDNPDPELGELPQVCAHFVIDVDGTIHRLVPLSIMCRHTVGLNYTAIGIEHAGYADQDVMGNGAQLQASLALTRWLRCRFGIPVRDVIGHNESLSSRFHHENVAALQSQTHGDMQAAAMTEYRRLLAEKPC